MSRRMLAGLLRESVVLRCAQSCSAVDKQRTSRERLHFSNQSLRAERATPADERRAPWKMYFTARFFHVGVLRDFDRDLQLYQMRRRIELMLYAAIWWGSNLSYSFLTTA